MKSTCEGFGTHGQAVAGPVDAVHLRRQLDLHAELLARLPLGPVLVKGLEAPIEVYEVTRRRFLKMSAQPGLGAWAEAVFVFCQNLSQPLRDPAPDHKPMHMEGGMIASGKIG